MPCTCPIDAWRPAPGSETGRLVFSPIKTHAGARHYRVPCGRCNGCRLDRARDWSTRIMHEVRTAGPSSFITPTYDPQFCPRDGSVSRREVQLLMKRIRHQFGPVRFFGVGEYGGDSRRPHYHLILFGLIFEDRTFWKSSPSGERLYRSASLEKCWQRDGSLLGHILIGDVGLDAAEYCARYTTKKMGGTRASDAYYRYSDDPVTGERREWYVEPEFALMSRRPGIGSDWMEVYGLTDCSGDFVTVEGKRRPLPAYYDARLPPSVLKSFKFERQARAAAHNEHEARLLQRHQFDGYQAHMRARNFGGEDV